MDPSSIFLWIGAIALLLLVSAFFAGSETALTAVSRGKMHQLEKDGDRSAANINLLVLDRERMIGALLLGNTFVNILASSLATSILETNLGPRAVAVATAIMTVLILIFVEVLPKTLAIARTDRFALTVAWPVRWRSWSFWRRSSTRCSSWCGACWRCSACARRKKATRCRIVGA